MECKDILNLTAIIIIPIVAVLISLRGVVQQDTLF